MNDKIKNTTLTFSIQGTDGTWSKLGELSEINESWIDDGLTRDEDWEIPSFMRKSNDTI